MISRRTFTSTALLSVAGLPAARGAWAQAPAPVPTPTSSAAERYRPVLHFTPPQGFMNDPNGLVFADGEWHLFYQHNPFEAKMGRVHWGHAVSRDLLHWQTLPLALRETAAGQAFSGSAVIDRANSSGLFAQGSGNARGGMVAIYTRASATRQVQALAYSSDGGRSFADYRGNPVLDVGSDQFRDPKVFWHAPSKAWVMCVVRSREHRVMFYRSRNLKDWRAAGEFAHAGVYGIGYECPDLVELPVAGGGTRWVLFLSINPGAPQGGSTVQYFVGGFDGRRFVPDDGATRFADFGKDFYALQTFGGVDGAPVGIAWMNNWQYANDLPTGAWRGAMTLPRRLSLRKVADDWKLVQEPLGLDAARRQVVAQGPGKASTALPPDTALEIRLTCAPDSVTSLRLANGDGEYLEVGYDPGPAVGSVWVDRGGARGFRHRFFTDKMSWAPPPDGAPLDLRLVFDRCSLELFAAGGTGCATLLHFFAAPPDRLELAADGKLPEVTVHALLPTGGR